MIQTESELNVADNGGAKIVQCIRVLGSTRRRYAGVGDVIVVTVKMLHLPAALKGNSIQSRNREDLSSYSSQGWILYRFDDNAVVLLTNADEPRGTRIFGPVARELRDKNYMRIVSLAPEVL